LRAKIRWSPSAEGDLLELLRFIGASDIPAAFKVYDEIREQSSVLEAYPFIGRSGRVAGTRELVVTRTPYIIAYRVSSEGVDILRVLHGARKWPTRF
jgi:toxin ParE1/3/4